MLFPVLLSTQSLAFQHTQTFSYTLQTSFNTKKSIAFSNLYLEIEENPSVDAHVFTIQQTEEDTAESGVISSDNKEKKKDGILKKQKDRADSRYAHPVFKTSQNISRIGTTLWVFGIPTAAIGGLSFIVGAVMMAYEPMITFGLTTGAVGLGMVFTGGGLVVAGNIAAAIALRKLNIDVPRYGWWLVGGSLLIPALIQVVTPVQGGLSSLLSLGAPIGLIWQIRLNRKAYKTYIENNETALYTQPENSIYNFQYK